MAKFKLDKMEAAQRQIHAAIRMTFAGEDPAAIHSVAAAARGLLKSLCEAAGQVESFERFTDWIAPKHEAAFWRAVNTSANFLKHADQDPEAVLELDEEETDFVILLAAKWYKDLTGLQSAEMKAFALWFTIQHPNVMSHAARVALEGAGFPQLMAEIGRLGSNLSRDDHLKIGRALLDQHLRRQANGSQERETHRASSPHEERD